MLTFSKPRLFTAATLGAAAALLTSPIFAQERARLPSECRQEIRELCGSDRSQIRACLRENFSELSSECAAELRERMQARAGRTGRTGPASQPFQASTRVSRTVIYGQHLRQKIDVYEPADAVDELPLVLFIHGGGWSMGDHRRVQAKPAHFTASGYYFASAGYRILPDSPVEEQAADIGAAIQALRGQAAAIGFDPDRMVLMGHSAGAHLAALVATDPSYAGEAFDAVQGVVLLDGAGYDVPQNIANPTMRAPTLYRDVFGDDLVRQRALSPVTHVGGSDAPNWLALYVEERERSREQSQQLVEGLSAEGASAAATGISNTDHSRMNREIGTPAGAQQTDAIDAFLARIFG